MYVVRALGPVFFYNVKAKISFSALALFYIRDKSYFRFLPLKKKLPKAS